MPFAADALIDPVSAAPLSALTPLVAPDA